MSGHRRTQAKTGAQSHVSFPKRTSLQIFRYLFQIELENINSRTDTDVKKQISERFKMIVSFVFTCVAGDSVHFSIQRLAKLRSGERMGRMMMVMVMVMMMRFCHILRLSIAREEAQMRRCISMTRFERGRLFSFSERAKRLIFISIGIDRSRDIILSSSSSSSSSSCCCCFRRSHGFGCSDSSVAERQTDRQTDGFEAPQGSAEPKEEQRKEDRREGMEKWKLQSIPFFFLLLSFFFFLSFFLLLLLI